QGLQVPVGATLSFRAIATLQQTVPPGTDEQDGIDDGVETRDEDVTATADWQSGNSAFATVDNGNVLGVAPSGGAVRITAAYEGFVPGVSVTVTNAELLGVDHVRPE